METRGFEPLTPCVQSRCSPAELRPHALQIIRDRRGNSTELPLRGILSQTRIYSQTTAIPHGLS